MIMNRTMDKRTDKFTIPSSLVREAELMSQTTHLSFRDCLELLIKVDKNLKIDNEDTAG